MSELEQIIQLHKKLIYKIATKFHGVPYEDLYQAGVIGIIKAYNNFKNDGTTKFTTYAYNYIFGEMYELANLERPIKVNKKILKLYKKIEQSRYLLAQKLGYMPSIKELSSFLNIEEKIIKEAYECTAAIMSLDAVDPNNEKPIVETISNPKTDIKLEQFDLKESLNNLTNEERKIISYRYFKDFTQMETAKILGMSQVKVSRYEKKSLNKMYNYLSL